MRPDPPFRGLDLFGTDTFLMYMICWAGSYIMFGGWDLYGTPATTDAHVFDGWDLYDMGLEQHLIAENMGFRSSK